MNTSITVRRALAIEALEPRLLHAADGTGVAAAEAVAALSGAHAGQAAVAWIAPVSPHVAQPSAELVVVDARVPDVQRLLDGFQAQAAAGRPLQVLVLGEGDDAVAAIDAALRESGGTWSAIHLVGHGEPGAMVLGSTRFDAALLRLRAGEIADWSTRLDADADLMLWGCDTGAGGLGAALLDGLAALTGADVAASDDATGGLAAGGDWTLEATRGWIETAALLDEDTRAAYGGVLALGPDGASAGDMPAAQHVQAEAGNVSVAGRQVATGARGTVTVWAEDDTGAGVRRVMARFDEADGTTGTAFEIAQDDPGEIGSPVVAVDSGGRAVVAWVADGQVRVAYLAPPASAGGALSVIATARADSPGDAGQAERDEPSVAMSPDGTRVVVAWRRSGSGVFDIDIRRFTLQAPTVNTPGSLVASEASAVMVTNIQGMLDGRPDVAIRNDGSGVVVLQATAGSEPTSPPGGVYLAYFGADGSIATSRPDYVDGSGLRLAVNTATVTMSAPSIAMDAAGNGLAVWLADDGTTRRLMAVAFDATGMRGAVIEVDAGTQALRPSVAAFGVGRFAVAWEGTIDVATGTDISLVEVSVDAAGAAVRGVPILANPQTAGDQRAPSVAAGAGRIVVGWTTPEASPGTGVSLATRSFVGLGPADPVLTRVGSVDEATEGGAVLQYDVTLGSEPVDPVTVTLSVSRPGQLTLSHTTLVFDASNWHVAQRVTLTAVDESIDDGDLAITLTADASSARSTSRTVTVIDNDTASTFVVTTTDDVDDTGDAALSALDLYEHSLSGTVSLREALRAANDTTTAAGVTTDSRDRIEFSLGAGTHRIVLTSALDAITRPVDLQGTVDADGAPLVELTRNYTATSTTPQETDGLVLAAGSDGSRIAGLAIGGFTDAISIRSSDNLVEGNWLGVAADGTAFANSHRGIEIHDATSADSVDDNRVRGNRIENNAEGGIRVLGDKADRAVIVGNTIRGNGVGGAVLGGYGIYLSNNADNASIGRDPATGLVSGNTIDGNGANGIVSLSRGHTFIGNTITGQTNAIDLRHANVPNVPQIRWAEQTNGATGPATQVNVALSGRNGETWRIDFYVDATANGPGSPTPLDTAGWQADLVEYITFTRNGTRTVAFTLPIVPPTGAAIVATATRVTSPAGASPEVLAETSELSAVAWMNYPTASSNQTFGIAEVVEPGATGPRAVDRIVLANTGGSLIESWTIVGGAHRSQFSIDAGGTLWFNAPPDAEGVGGTGPRLVTVRATNATGGWVEVTANVTVSDRNDPPVLTLPATIVGDEDVRLTAPYGAGATILSDQDTQSRFQEVSLVLSVDRGRLSLTGSTSGVASTVSSNGDRVELRGRAASVNAALARLAYQGDADWFGTATLSVDAVDTGTSSLRASGRVTLDIRPVNDVPVLQTANGASLLIGQRVGIGSGSLRSSDVDNGADAIRYRIVSAPAIGTVRVGDVDLAVGDTFTQADVDAGRVSYGGNREGTVSVVLSVSDAAGGAATANPVTLSFELKTPPIARAAASSGSQGGSGASAAGAASGEGQVGSSGQTSGSTAAGTSTAAGATAVAGVGSTAAAPAAVPAVPAAAVAPAFVRPAAAAAGGAADATASLSALNPGNPTASTGAGEAMGSGAPGASSERSFGREMAALGSSARVAAGGRESDGPRSLAGPTSGSVSMSQIAQAWSPVAALETTDYASAVQQTREEAVAQFEARTVLVTSSVMLGTSLSIGYAVWMARGGVLLTSLLASMPAWRSIDPLPVLARTDALGRDDETEDDSLRGLLSRAAEQAREGVPAERPQEPPAARLGIVPT